MNQLVIDPYYEGYSVDDNYFMQINEADIQIASSTSSTIKVIDMQYQSIKKISDNLGFLYTTKTSEKI